MELFPEQEQSPKQKKIKDEVIPLAERMHPTSLENFVGQTYVLSEEKSIKKRFESWQKKTRF